MQPDHSPHNSIFEAIDILTIIRAKITDDVNLTWTTYASANEIRKELDDCIIGMKNRELEKVYRVGVFFIPTGDFQNLAIDNGWGDEFLLLADRFDANYNQLISQLKS